MGLSTASTRAPIPAGPRRGVSSARADRDAWPGGASASNAWSHLATTFDGSVLRLYVNGTLASSTTSDRFDRNLDGGVAHWWQQRLGGVVRWLDRRGARLQPGAERGRGAAGHADGCGRLAAAARHVSALGSVGSDGVDRDRVGDARLDGVQRQRGRRSLQRAPLADRGLHACRREPDRSADGHELSRILGSPPAPTTTG